MNAVLISFVIPVRNDAERLKRCLASIRANGATGIEVLVADNGSTDATITSATSAGALVMSLPGLRVSALRNQAAARASSAILAFVDADHEITSNWISSALDAMDDRTVGAAGALYTAPDNTWVQRMYGALRGRTCGRHDVDWLGSGNLAVRAEAFRAIGGFDETLETCEDVDFCQRLRAAGWRLVGDERLESLHLGDPSSLRALFKAERWRGRDNIRVSLRGPLRLRDVPSLVIPVIQLLAGITAACALIAAPFAPLPAVAALILALLAIAGLSALRAGRMLIRAGLSGVRSVMQAFAVAATYDLARAFALVSRAPHHRDGSARHSPAHVS